MQITKACPMCGSVEFKVKAFFESYNTMCSSCNNEISTILLDKYVKMEDVCNSCGNDIFKAKVKKLKNKELWTITCTKCGNEPRKYCADKDGNEITYDDREKYLLKDVNEELEMENEILYDEKHEIEKVINMLESEIDEKDQEIRVLKHEIHEKKDEIRELKNEIDDKDDEIKDLNKRLTRYIDNMSELQEEVYELRNNY
jgi:predicted RNase H-like nuclease (RuvC/YqgF family)